MEGDGFNRLCGYHRIHYHLRKTLGLEDWGCNGIRGPTYCFGARSKLFPIDSLSLSFPSSSPPSISNFPLPLPISSSPTPLVVIVGHESCGGVAASLAAARSAGETSPPSPEGALQRHLSPLVKLAQSVVLDPENKDLSDAELVQKITEASVISQMKNVAETDVLERNWKGEKSPLSGKVMEKVTVHG